MATLAVFVEQRSSISNRCYSLINKARRSRVGLFYMSRKSLGTKPLLVIIRSDWKFNELGRVTFHPHLCFLFGQG